VLEGKRKTMRGIEKIDARGMLENLMSDPDSN
jgi:hypothetical protein